MEAGDYSVVFASHAAHLLIRVFVKEEEENRFKFDYATIKYLDNVM